MIEISLSDCNFTKSAFLYWNCYQKNVHENESLVHFTVSETAFVFYRITHIHATWRCEGVENYVCEKRRSERSLWNCVTRTKSVFCLTKFQSNCFWNTRKKSNNLFVRVSPPPFRPFTDFPPPILLTLTFKWGDRLLGRCESLSRISQCFSIPHQNWFNSIMLFHITCNYRPILGLGLYKLKSRV